MNLEKLCQQVVLVAEEAGRFIEKELTSFNSAMIELKGKNDLVSYVDKEAEKIIVSGLRLTLPEAGYITEEGTIEKENKKFQWVIDPLDGTTNFMHKVPPFCVSIALTQNEEVLIGVVYEVCQKECFSAYKGGGAFLNGNPIKVSDSKKLNESLIATGFPYSLLGKADNHFETIKAFVKSTHGVRRLGSAAADLCYVACGRFEAYYEFNLKIWDIAAGVLIVQEAGGKVSDFAGENDFLSGKEIIASNNFIHQQSMDVINKYW